MLSSHYNIYNFYRYYNPFNEIISLKLIFKCVILGQFFKNNNDFKKLFDVFNVSN